jgi:hypothetical protein
MRRNHFEFALGDRPLDAEDGWSQFVEAIYEHAPADRTVTVSHRTLQDNPGGVLAQVSAALDLPDLGPSIGGLPEPGAAEHVTSDR